MRADRPACAPFRDRAHRKEPRLLVQVVQHLDVIGQKADRVDQDMLGTALLQVSQMIEDIGPEPRILRPAAPALIDESPLPRGYSRCSATSRHVSSIWCSYSQFCAIETGMLCAVNATCSALACAQANCSRASRTRSALAAMNSGWL